MTVKILRNNTIKGNVILFTRSFSDELLVLNKGRRIVIIEDDKLFGMFKRKRYMIWVCVCVNINKCTQEMRWGDIKDKRRREEHKKIEDGINIRMLWICGWEVGEFYNGRKELDSRWAPMRGHSSCCTYVSTSVVCCCIKLNCFFFYLWCMHAYKYERISCICSHLA